MSAISRTGLRKFVGTLVACLAISTVASADDVRFLRHPQDSLAEFSRLITSAKKSISVATFIFDPCSTSTQLLMAELAAKAKAGVRVRMLLDDFQLDSDYKQNLINFAKSSGIDLRLYGEVVVDDFNSRMHIKFMTVDGKAVIAGGRNLSDDYFQLSTVHNYVDRDLSIEGKAAKDAEASFMELWNSERTTTTSNDAKSFTAWNSACGPDAHLAKKVAALKSYLAGDGVASLQKVPVRVCSTTKFRSDNPDFRDIAYGFDQSEMNSTRLAHKRATNNVLHFLAGAKTNVIAENYSYMPVGLLAKAFAKLRAKKVQVTALSNGDMEDGPDFFKEIEEYAISSISAHDSTGSEKVTLVSSQGELADSFALTPHGMLSFLHGKTLVRDHKDVIVGSFNLDGRSESINLESILIVTDCAQLASDVEDSAKDLLGVAKRDAQSGKIPEKPEANDFIKFLESTTVDEL